MCYFSCKAQRITIPPGFNLIQILGKIQDGGQDGDSSTKGKIVSKYCNISKIPGRGSIHLPLLYHGGGMNLLVRPRVN